MGLLLEQPRGPVPLSAPPCSEGGVRNNMIQLRKQNTKSNNPSFERLEELLFLGSEITRSADFWPRLFLNPEITMISGPIVEVFFLA